MRFRHMPALAALLALAVPAASLANAPSMISYQGVLLQDNGIVVQDGAYSLQFRLFPQAVGGTTPLFQQTLTVEVRKGLYNVILSNQGGFDLQQIFVDNEQLFMEVTVKANVPLGLPNDVVLQPRQQLVSVPYALATRGGATDAVVPIPLAVPRPMSSNNFQTVSGLDPIVMSTPAAGCHVRVHASVALSPNGGTRLVAVRLEQSTNGTAFAPVRGPWVGRMTNNAEVLNASLDHLVRDAPANATYTYRVTVMEAGGDAFIVSPSALGVGQTESLLEGQVWCP